MRIVFLVHYFPPLNSSGARRVLAFTKYLSRYGHQVTVLTTRKTSWDGQLTERMPDYCRIIELGGASVYEAKPSQKQNPTKERSGLVAYIVNARRATAKLFGQLLDHRISFAFRFLLKRLPFDAIDELESADILVSSCPPWPMHLAAYFASHHFGKAWVADYRDMFSGHHLFESNSFSASIETALERLMLSRATSVTVVSSPMAEYYQRFHSKVDVIENGYDAETIEAIRNKFPRITESVDRKIVRYVGTITKQSITKDRIPNLLEAIRMLSIGEQKRLLIQFYGDSGTLPTVVNDRYPDLNHCIEFNGFVSHSEALRLILTADGLFFSGVSSGESLSVKGVLTTKLFEYLASGVPIVADIAQDSLAGEIILRSGLGLVCSTDPYAIAQGLKVLISGDVSVRSNLEFVTCFSRESQAKRFEQILQVAVRTAVR